MSAIAWMVQRFNWLSEYFYDAYREINSWPWPFWMGAWPFYAISSIVSDIAWDLLDFLDWVTFITNQIRGVLRWDEAWRKIRASIWWIFYDILKLPEWWTEVTRVITSWWISVEEKVVGWIDVAKVWTKLWLDYLQDQVTALGARIDDVLALIPDVSEIQAWFTNWPGHVMTVVSTWWTGALTEVQSLISSAFTEREPFWAGWQDWRDKVTEFFTDPEDWLYKSLDRIIERFW